ncbi:CCKAR [Mytilus coruscus]|uniref:CCKAR n=1 Tax=Mytilus coruscus TaxID=42192 RepID=A0A6J8BR33_MYTCO|nr:CCKAR [Mytilus coruscus]
MQVMTIERFRRVCRPLKIQMSAKIALSCMITICIASSVVTIPNLFIRGIHTVRLGDNDTGHDCSIADKFIGSKLVLYYNAALLITSIANIASVVLQYIFIGRQIYKHFQFVKRFRSKSEQKYQTTVISFISIVENKTCDKYNVEYNHKRRKIALNNKAVVNAADRTSYKSTRIAVIVSVFFIISYVPTLLESVLEAIYGEEYIGMFISLPVRNIIEKTFAINHVVNPFIYGFLDKTFRTDCRDILNCC